MLAKAIRLPLRLIPDGTVVPVLTGGNRGMRWIVGTHTHGCWIGHYERAKQCIIRAVVKPGMTCIDVGANAGFYTLMFSRLVGPTGRVMAIEPLPENVRALRRHISLNRLTNVDVIEAAASDASGLVSFDLGPNKAQGRIADRGMEVRAITLDSLGAADVVKMDIEGGELQALRGATSLLALRRTTWLIALDDPATARPCRDLFTGYHVEEFCQGEIVATPLGSPEA